jgi:Uma2 family endonuclease
MDRILERQGSTIAEFTAFLERPENRDRRLELIEGEIVEKPMPNQIHGRLAMNIGAYFVFYLKQNRIGYAETEVRYAVEGDDQNVRMPDVSVFLDVNSPAVASGAVPRMPDIAVEVKSPSDSLLKMREKILYYLANGTRLGILFYPEKRLIEMYPAGADSYTLREGDVLECQDILPGFTVPVSELFEGV